MKIGMILDEKYPPHPRVKNEAINLMEAGHEIILFSTTGNAGREEEVIDDIQVVRFPVGKMLRKFSALAYTIFVYRWLMQAKIREFIRDYQPDALYVHNMRIGKAALKASKGFSGKLIIDLHENIPEIMKMYHHVTHFPGTVLIYPSLWKKWEKKLVKAYDKIVVVTDEASDDLVANYGLNPSKIIIVPNSVQPSFYENYKVDESLMDRFKSNFNLFYFGDTGIRRGLETAIRSLVELKELIPNIKLIIVGSSKSDPYLRQVSKELQVADYIAFEGFQNESTLHSYISVSNICISPLLRNRHHDTTYANKIFQYMALGKPMIVSNCPAQERIVNQAQSGLVFEAGNVAEFVKSVHALFQDEELNAKLGKNGANFIQNQYNQRLKSQGLIEYFNSLA